MSYKIPVGFMMVEAVVVAATCDGCVLKDVIGQCTPIPCCPSDNDEKKHQILVPIPALISSLLDELIWVAINIFFNGGCSF